MTPEPWRPRRRDGHAERRERADGSPFPRPSEVAATDELLTALSRGGAPDPRDRAALLLALLVEEVNQRRSSVSMTPST